MSHCFNLSSKTPPFLLVCCLLLVSCWSAVCCLFLAGLLLLIWVSSDRNFNAKSICKRISWKILLCGFDISIHQLKPEIINTETAHISRKFITHSLTKSSGKMWQIVFFIIFVFDICHETETDKHKWKSVSRIGQN